MGCGAKPQQKFLTPQLEILRTVRHFFSNVSINISSLTGFLINIFNWRYKGHMPEAADDYNIRGITLVSRP